jgi:lipid-A-disaccharide synthase
LINSFYRLALKKTLLCKKINLAIKFYIIAGEASGDLHASNLIKSLKQKAPDAQFRAWGGELMQVQGAHIVKHYRELAFMGFLEVLLNLKTILNNLSFCKQDIIEYKPDVLILIDYPGFNMRIAEFAKAKSIKVFYYISPQIWAWKQSRVHKLKKSVDKMFVILPFEKDFYAKFDMHVEFVGHPLLDAIAEPNGNADARKSFIEKHQLGQQPIIALLPGSRKQEIKSILPLLLQMPQHFGEYQFVIAGAPSQENSFYQEFIANTNIKILFGETYSLLQFAHAAIVTSGTATLETALFEVPQVVVYKAGNVSYQIAKKLIKVKYISLVNLIMDREIIKELIQNEANIKELKKELSCVLNDEGRTKIKNDYHLLKEKLGGKGASEKTANLMLKTLSQG